MNYKHTQIWYLSLYLFLWFFVYFFVISLLFPNNYIFSIFVSVLILITISFSYLAVEIDDKFLRIKFSYWIFRKSFLLEDIESVRKVVNPLYYWFWIRVWFWPYMWIYNVDWFDAVEITMKNWKIYRIWTDEVDKLEEAINKKIKKQENIWEKDISEDLKVLGRKVLWFFKKK